MLQKDALCPNFLKWSEVSVEGDSETIQLLRAWINAVLVGRPELQRFLHLIGPAGTGKSTFLRLIFQLVGKENFTTTSLNNWKQIGSRLQIYTASDWLVLRKQTNIANKYQSSNQ